MAQNPDLMLFDEPESGVDVENMALVGNTIAMLLEKDYVSSPEKPAAQRKRERTRMGLIITHTGHILDYVPADKGQVLFNGVLSCASNPREILNCVRSVGYEECVRCTIGMSLGRERSERQRGKQLSDPMSTWTNSIRHRKPIQL
jgi:Fe-S cluster assembly ATP-binding protein